ncbi:hypothetical protein [Amycolatopsis jejuensis]|uniref:hypothetical protein n=1 Tax=Amycolatopsis jejuensis TaxID=330084 RepID=UPI0005275435|nr:hypothetical protein [Amycolatopsis jejuensis]
MAVKKLNVHQDVRARLGNALIDELAAHMYAVDCQTCGHALGRLRAPALGVRDFGEVANATLNHRRCLKQPWVSAAEPRLSGPRHLSWRTKILQLDSDRKLLFLVNPSLEGATLLPGEGGWRYGTVEYRVRSGMRTDDDPGFVDAMTARLLPEGHLEVEFAPVAGVPAEVWRWTIPAVHPFAAVLRSLDQVLIAITTALDLDAPTTGDALEQAIVDGRVAFGSAELTRT